MSAQNEPNPEVRAPSPLRRFLWDGVLPEALGLCFVAIIFGGFAIAYVVADRTWKRHLEDAAQAQAENLAQVVASALGATGDADGRAAEDLLASAGRLPHFRSACWTTPTGEVRLAWPPLMGAVPGLTDAALAADGTRPIVATAEVRTPAGQSAGTLRIAVGSTGGAGPPAILLVNWGIAAGVTLLVFAALYHRLRRHVRPMAAIERTLHSYTSGLEKELTTLTLSDSLGSVAHGWNGLIEQLVGMQRELEDARQVGHQQNVLARFESAVFRRVVDRLPFGVLCIGSDDSVTYANGSAAALLGHSPDQLASSSLGEAIDDPAVTQALVSVRARGGGGRSVDHTRREGEEHETSLRFHILPLSESGTGNDALVAIEDTGQLRESQRARDNFLYHVTHELRTPLTNIHAYAETLSKPAFDDEQTRRECYNVIISETRRLSRLVEDILCISQLEVGTARLNAGEVDFQRLLRQIVQDNLGAADEKHVDLTLSLPPKVPKIQGDKQRLSVLLNNLIGNAVKYTPPDGKVQVKCEVDDDCLRIAVSDSGIGIAPQDQAHVFDKFYRATDDAVQSVTGTGLGLALAREVAHLHGGDIQLESSPGQGSTFTVELPAPSASPAGG